ncbi:FecR family protein [Flagellimonas okinawensis]|uniref:FecR domain-containing protein n=1 Tax=Flagellimonas okinawensis TaxID=3031324 RepID=A0ABT5XT04_9FLAO|nr:FecR domain-containing protein [[Muricauda] okinawensis]MDF0709026.1 FecR domain-containing protein [[Muricauda] okinawensis]
MTKLDIRRIITRYINQEASQEELAILYEWVKKGNNKEVFKKLVQADYLVNYEDRSWQSEAAFENFLHTIKEREDKKVRSLNTRPYLWKYAAIITIMVGSSLFFLLNQQPPVDIPMEIDPNLITLQLDNGEVLTLDPDSDATLQSKKGGTVVSLVKGMLTQREETEVKGRAKHNTIKVPYGKKISVTLQDGSTVLLNSGSSMTYPSSFEAMDNREVTLVGEAFFEVAKNPDKPFFVRTDKMYTRVFGTVFNVSAYGEDLSTAVVLVEGSVGVGSSLDAGSDGLQMLLPSQKASNTYGEGGAFTVEDVDVSPYISWTKGVLAFENEPMGEIIKRLQRQYNIRIENRYGELDQRRFTGMFDEEDIDRVLRTIQAHTHFSYEKQDNQIIINKPNKQ